MDNPMTTTTITNNQLLKYERDIINIENTVLGLWMKEKIEMFRANNQDKCDAIREKIKEANHRYFVMENENKVKYKKPSFHEAKKGAQPTPVLKKGMKMEDYSKEMKELHEAQVEVIISIDKPILSIVGDDAAGC